MSEGPVGTSADIEPFVNEARALLDGVQDATTFKKHWIRLIGQATRVPGETWIFISEIFYAVEEHIAEPESRVRKGGLDDDELRHAVSSQLPALEEEADRVRAVEEGRPRPALLADTGSGAELLRLIRDLLEGTVTPAQFAAEFREHLARSRTGFSPRVRAAAEAVGLAIDRYRSDGTPLRMYDSDEVVLRRRVADVEPRLAAAVEL
ncbi:hypothetical protein ACFPK1_02355 [Actinomycetospora rhizophila]|uniref:Uncharacterized protein n=1 Tax=Actinomycetospora rhizophila TaxID=1416876 RepID=A0ABV9Z6V2_9PSEU